MKKGIHIQQHDRTDCAAACVASICAYYGLRLPMIRFREICGTGEDGATLQGIIDAFGKLGMEAAGFKAKELTTDGLRTAKKPLILHLKKKNGWLHFVVLYEVREKDVLIMDPEAAETIRMSNEELLEEWSGYVVAAAPGKTFEKGDRRTKVFKRFKELLLKNRRSMFLIFGGTLAYIAVTLGTSMFLQKTIDDVLPARNTSTLALFGITMIVIALLMWFSSYVRNLLLVRTSLNIDRHLISGYFRKIFSLPISFFDSRSTGELNARISDAYRIRSFITGRILLMTVSSITLVTAIAILMSFYWKLTLILLAFIPVFCLLYAISDRLNKRINRRIIENNTRFEETNIETLSCARAYIYYNAAGEAVRKIEKQYSDTASAIYNGGKLGSMVSASSDGIGRLLYAVILLSGAFFVLDGALSIGELVSFLTIATMVTSPVTMLIESNREITEAMISAERIFDIMDMENNEGQGLPTNAELPEDAVLKIRHLSFSFPGRRRLIEDLSCDILPGKINVIKGRNGSGKSTLAALLMRGYEPLSGEILLGDTDIRRIPAKTWRQHIAIIPQKPDIFKGSILDNIVMGDTDYDSRTLAGICAAAGMADMIDKLPDGLLSETGGLSGGERQKIAIARALYHKANILIFDEAGTYLDKEGKARLEDTIRLLQEHGTTIIVISHTEDNIDADNIIEL